MSQSQYCIYIYHNLSVICYSPSIVHSCHNLSVICHSPSIVYLCHNPIIICYISSLVYLFLNSSIIWHISSIVYLCHTASRVCLIPIYVVLTTFELSSKPYTSMSQVLYGVFLACFCHSPSIAYDIFQCEQHDKRIQRTIKTEIQLYLW